MHNMNNLKFTAVSFIIHPFVGWKVMIQHKHVMVNVYVFHLHWIHASVCGWYICICKVNI